MGDNYTLPERTPGHIRFADIPFMDGRPMRCFACGAYFDDHGGYAGDVSVARFVDAHRGCAEKQDERMRAERVVAHLPPTAFDFRPPPTPPRVVQIAAVEGVLLALRDDGTIWEYADRPNGMEWTEVPLPPTGE